MLDAAALCLSDDRDFHGLEILFTNILWEFAFVNLLEGGLFYVLGF